jgi:hypothetical protein
MLYFTRYMAFFKLPVFSNLKVSKFLQVKVPTSQGSIGSKTHYLLNVIMLTIFTINDLLKYRQTLGTGGLAQVVTAPF